MRKRVIFCASVALFITSAQRAAAGPGELIVNHQPHPFGGGGSDTEFRDDFGFPVWQRVADDIMLDQSATVGHVKWWGFYGSSFKSPPPAPPATETMRIRLYNARPSGGLPGDVLFEEEFLNPSRTATGNTVAVGSGAPEYLFNVDLDSLIQLAANTPYWLEIVQLGELESTFRWEFSQSQANGQAFINPNVGDWQHTQSITSDTAYQLWTIPEPASFVLFAFGLIGAIARRRSSRE